MRNDPVRDPVCPPVPVRDQQEEYFLQQAQKSGMDSKELLRTAAALAAHSDAKEREELVEELEHLIAELKGSEEK